MWVHVPVQPPMTITTSHCLQYTKAATVIFCINKQQGELPWPTEYSGLLK